MTRQSVGQFAIIIACMLLAGCDQLSERAGFPDPAKIEAEGKAIGGACRHAGRGLEDCYRLNKEASKSAVYAGWKEMNEYMVKNNMQAVIPSIPAKPDFFPRLKKKSANGGEDIENPDEKSPQKGKHDDESDTAASRGH
jgi:hypothetical protein